MIFYDNKDGFTVFYWNLIRNMYASEIFQNRALSSTLKYKEQL